jgi:nuclear receptor subfamily 1 group D protein 3
LLTCLPLFLPQAGVFEVLLVRLACMFDSTTNSMICLNGLVLRRESLHSASNARFLMDSMFDFAERMNSLRLTDHEIGLFSAVVVIAPGKSWPMAPANRGAAGREGEGSGVTLT